MINYKYIFEKMGERKRTCLENEVWLDVGNALEMGCFDHHHKKGYKSTPMAILDNLKYLDNLKKSAGAKKEEARHGKAFEGLLARYFG